MDELPEITEVQRLRLEPGDALVVHLNAHSIDMESAGLIQARVRAVLGLDDSFPVLLLAKDTDVEVVSTP